jgi:hypothetical protein
MDARNYRGTCVGLSLALNTDVDYEHENLVEPARDEREWTSKQLDPSLHNVLVHTCLGNLCQDQKNVKLRIASSARSINLSIVAHRLYTRLSPYNLRELAFHPQAHLYYLPRNSIRSTHRGGIC